MSGRRTRCASLVLAIALLQACSQPDTERSAATSDSLASVGKRAPGLSPSTPDTLRLTDPGQRGHVSAQAINWDAPTVAGHLRGIGLTAKAAGVVARPMFRVQGQRFHVNGGRAMVEAYFYGDASAVALDTDKLDTVHVMTTAGAIRWERPARLIIDNTMAAVVLTDDAALRKTSEAALRSDLHGSIKVE